MTPQEPEIRPAEEPPLLDFPLRGAGLFDPAMEPEPVDAKTNDAAFGAAALSRRWSAMAADAAIVCLVAAAAILSASALRGGSPTLSALAWAAAFALYLSFFATVLPLVLFGRTVGMALADLSARAPGDPRIRSSEATRRWLGTLATLATLGIPLLLIRRDPRARTPADRLSGRALVESDRVDRP